MVADIEELWNLDVSDSIFPIADGTGKLSRADQDIPKSAKKLVNPKEAKRSETISEENRTGLSR